MDAKLLPATHMKKQEERRHFEDFVVGELFYIPSRTQTDAIFGAFQTVSGDNRPLHYDAEYCRDLGYPGMVAHAMQVLSATALGASDFPHHSGYGIINLSATFKKVVCASDTIYPQLKIVELRSGKTTGVGVIRNTVHNQRGELLMDGRIEFLVRRRPSA